MVFHICEQKYTIQSKWNSKNNQKAIDHVHDLSMDNFGYFLVSLLFSLSIYAHSNHFLVAYGKFNTKWYSTYVSKNTHYNQNGIQETIKKLLIMYMTLVWTIFEKFWCQCYSHFSFMLIATTFFGVLNIQILNCTFTIKLYY